MRRKSHVRFGGRRLEKCHTRQLASRLPYHDGTCDACLDNAADQEDPHAVANHEFVYCDEATAESEYLTQKAFELGFPFEDEEPESGEKVEAASEPPPSEAASATRDAPSDSWFIEVALREYQRDGYIDVDVDEPLVSRGEAGAYVKAWLFVDYPDADVAQVESQARTEP